MNFKADILNFLLEATGNNPQVNFGKEIKGTVFNTPGKTMPEKIGKLIDNLVTKYRIKKGGKILDGAGRLTKADGTVVEHGPYDISTDKKSRLSIIVTSMLEDEDFSQLSIDDVEKVIEYVYYLHRTGQIMLGKSKGVTNQERIEAFGKSLKSLVPDIIAGKASAHATDEHISKAKAAASDIINRESYGGAPLNAAQDFILDKNAESNAESIDNPFVKKFIIDYVLPLFFKPGVSQKGSTINELVARYANSVGGADAKSLQSQINKALNHKGILTLKIEGVEDHNIDDAFNKLVNSDAFKSKINVFEQNLKKIFSLMKENPHAGLTFSEADKPLDEMAKEASKTAKPKAKSEITDILDDNDKTYRSTEAAEAAETASDSLGEEVADEEVDEEFKEPEDTERDDDLELSAEIVELAIDVIKGIDIDNTYEITRAGISSMALTIVEDICDTLESYQLEIEVLNDDAVWKELTTKLKSIIKAAIQSVKPTEALKADRKNTLSSIDDSETIEKLVKNLHKNKVAFGKK